MNPVFCSLFSTYTYRLLIYWPLGAFDFTASSLYFQTLSSPCTSLLSSIILDCSLSLLCWPFLLFVCLSFKSWYFWGVSLRSFLLIHSMYIHPSRSHLLMLFQYHWYGGDSKSICISVLPPEFWSWMANYFLCSSSRMYPGHFPLTFGLSWWLSQLVNSLPVMQETRIQSLGREDPLKKEMATHSNIFAWESPWTEEPGGLQSMAFPESNGWGTKPTYTSKSVYWQPPFSPASYHTTLPILNSYSFVPFKPILHVEPLSVHRKQKFGRVSLQLKKIIPHYSLDVI